MSTIEQKLIDRIAELEVEALIEALQDPGLRLDPSILARARNFLKDNKLVTSPEIPGIKEIKKITMEIPDFTQDEVFEN